MVNQKTCGYGFACKCGHCHKSADDAFDDVDRRCFLTGSGMAFGLGLPLSQLGVFPSVAQTGSVGVDAHCHVFNASDLPVQNFIRRVVFEDYEDAVTEAAIRVPSPFAGLIAFLISFLKLGTISAKEELDRLRNVDEGILQDDDPFSGDVISELERLLQQFENPTESALAALSREEIEEFRKLIDAELALGKIPESEEEVASGRIFRLLRSGGLIGRHLRWAVWLRSPRLKISKEIERLYGGPNKVGLFTPAMIDFSKWLDEEPDSDIESQIKVMEAVQGEVIANRGFLMHSLAPYDPWRQIADEETGTGLTPLEMVKQAVQDRGFLGVKLYPPMGFLPGDNRKFKLPLPKRALLIDGFREKLDDALDKLYTWAERDGVAILSHAANSNGAGEGFSERANPSAWRPVLQRFPNLKLNLAHFGDFTHDHWEEDTGALLKDYPNVYADLSYLSSALTGNLSEIREIGEKIRTFLDTYDSSAQRLMFGSDWIMLGREADNERYFEAIKHLLLEAGITRGQWRSVRSENAVRFFGLKSGDPARSRLSRWYQRHHLDPMLLARFD